MDFLTLLVWVAFYALFAVSIRRYLQYRAPLDRSVMLVFGSSAAIFALSTVNLVLPSLGPWISPLAVTLLVAQPVLMVRLVGLFVRLPRLVVPAAAAGFVISVAAYYVTSRSLPALLLLVGYFAITEASAALALVLESRRRHGFPRVRLALAGAGSLLFGLAILVSGAASAARGGATADPAIVLVARSLALFAGLAYLAAFAPPHWLVRIAHRALAYDLVRSIVSAPTGSDQAVHWRALALAAGSILGTEHLSIWRGTEILADGHAEPGLACPDLARAATARGGEPGPHPDSVTVPVVSEGRQVATLSARVEGRALFLEDDLALIELLGSLTARAVEREQAVTALAEARQAVTEASAVRASEGRFRAFLEASPDAILAVDSRGRIRWSTRSAAVMFGISEPELAGRPLDAVVEARQPRREPSPAVAGGGDAVRYETVGRRVGGSTFPAEVALSSFELDGEPYQLAVVGDITWRREIDAIRERFIGVLSHELRTPITAIFGGSQLLLNRGDQLGATNRRELLTDIAGEAERLQRMIENLLVMARVEGGAELAETGPVLLHRVLPVVIEREQALWPEMQITAEMPPSLPPAIGDEASLALVVRNLISNAGKYAGPGAHVRVTVSPEGGDEVAVRVLDDGPGIDPGDAARLFDLYYRSKASQAMPGSGIGLFVCHSLVAAMGGRTWARPRPDGGAEFGFTLSVYADADADMRPTARSRSAVGAARSSAAVAPVPGA